MRFTSNIVNSFISTCVGLTLLACAKHQPHSSALKIGYGSKVSSDQDAHGSYMIVSFGDGEKDSEKVPYSTGTVVAVHERAFITAAHVYDDLTNNSRVDEIRIQSWDHQTIASFTTEEFKAVAFRNQDYNKQEVFEDVFGETAASKDLAGIVLDTSDIDADAGILPQSIDTGEIEKGQELRLVGAGAADPRYFEDSKTYERQSARVMRSGTNQVVEVFDKGAFLLGGSLLSQNSKDRKAIAFGGDSGGGSFHDGKLVGILCQTHMILEDYTRLYPNKQSPTGFSVHSLQTHEIIRHATSQEIQGARVFNTYSSLSDKREFLSEFTRRGVQLDFVSP